MPCCSLINDCRMSPHKKSAPEFTFALCINCVLSIAYNVESFYLYARGKSRGKAIIDKAKGRNVEGFRFASEFLRGDRIIMRPQWRWRDAFFPELCGSVTFGCGIGANAAQSAFIAPCFRGVGL